MAGSCGWRTMPIDGVLAVRVEPVREEGDARPLPNSREDSMAAATAIAVVLTFVIVAIVAYWMFVFQSS